MTDSKQILHRYELILTSAGEGIYGLDHQGKGTFVNPAATAMTGWTEDDVIGQAMHGKHHHSRANGEYYPQHECPIYAALQDGVVHHISDEVFWCKDGSSFPVHYTSTPIIENDTIVGAVVVFQDVSKLKQAEAKLTEFQRRNQLVLSAAGEGICGFNREGQVTFINPTASRLLNWQNQNTDSKTINDIFDRNEIKSEDYCPVQSIIRGKQRYQGSDIGFWRSDGSSFPVDFVSTPIMENNQVVGVVMVFSDITERKQAEQNLTNALSEIQQLKNRLQEENSYLQEQIKLTHQHNPDHQFEDILGQSQSLKTVLRQVEKVAPTDTSVLILGETGTGKELFARALHNLSQCNHRPLVKVNCAALPANLIESELFGHEKGSFIGATAHRIGRFELAHDGTIFLDEIAELPLELQAKLLRVLQEGEIERLGDSKTININVRIIAATHRNLKQMVADRTFREDLYYRLSVFPLTLPPLRERQHDISLLVQWFIDKYAKKMSKQINHIPKPVMENLLNYSWPSNLRELENVIERAVILSPDQTLQIAELHNPQSNSMADGRLLLSLAEMEKAHIVNVLESTSWLISGENGAASILEMHPNTLRSRMNKLGIRRASIAE